MNCPDDSTLSAYQDGELDSDEATRVQAHLAACTRCRSAMAEIRASDAAIRGMFEAIVPPKLSAPLPSASQAKPRMLSKELLAVAAMLVVTCALVAWLVLAAPHDKGQSVATPTAFSMATDTPPETPDVLPEATDVTPATAVASDTHVDAVDVPPLEIAGINETYDEFVRRVTTPSRPAVDELDPWQVENMRQRLLLATGIADNGNS